MKDTIYLIVGKSGSGKSAIVRELCDKYGYTEVQSYTERAPRYEGEKGHIFINSEEFDKLENLCAYTMFNGNRYGVTSDIVDDADLYVIDVEGVYYMKKHYKGKKNIVVIGIYCEENELDDLLQRASRMGNRGDSIKSIVDRLAYDEDAFKDLDRIVDYKIINVSLLDSINAIRNIMEGSNDLA